MKRLSVFILLSAVLCSLLLGGCANVSRLEEQAIISAIGIDKGESARFRVTVSVFQSMGAGSANPIDPSKPNTVVAHAEADSINDAMKELRLILGRQVNTGHTKYIILGSEMFAAPLHDTLRYFIANEQTYLGTPILATDKKASDILKVQLLNDVETAVAVESIIDTAIENGSALRTDLLMAANALTDNSPMGFPIITVKKPPKQQSTDSGKSSQESSGNSSEATEEPKFLLRGTLVSDMNGGYFRLDNTQTLGVSFIKGYPDFYEMDITHGKDKYSVSLSLLNHSVDLKIKDGKFVLYIGVQCMVRILESSALIPDYELVCDKATKRLEEICINAVSALRSHRFGDIIGVKKLAMSLYPFGDIDYDNIFTDCSVVVNVNVHSDR